MTRHTSVVADRGQVMHYQPVLMTRVVKMEFIPKSINRPQKNWLVNQLDSDVIARKVWFSEE